MAGILHTWLNRLQLHHPSLLVTTRSATLKSCAKSSQRCSKAHERTMMETYNTLTRPWNHDRNTRDILLWFAPQFANCRDCDNYLRHTLELQPWRKHGERTWDVCASRHLGSPMKNLFCLEFVIVLNKSATQADYRVQLASHQLIGHLEQNIRLATVCGFCGWIASQSYMF